VEQVGKTRKQDIPHSDADNFQTKTEEMKYRTLPRWQQNGS